MLIVEGPDGSGKTTLAKRIEEELKYEYRRPPTLSKTHGADLAVKEWWDEQINTHISARGIVYDRCFYVSEAIYQPPTSNRSLIVSGPDMLTGFTNLVNREPKIIFCLPDWEVTYQNIQAQEHVLAGVTRHDLEKIYWSYWNEYARWSNISWNSVTLWDYTHHNPQLLFEWVEGRG